MYWFELDPLRYGSVIKPRTGNHKSYDWVINRWEGYVKIPSFLNRPEVEKLIDGNTCWNHDLYIQHEDPITHKPTSDLWVGFDCSQVFDSFDIFFGEVIPIFKEAEYFWEARAECFRIIDGLVGMERFLRRTKEEILEERIAMASQLDEITKDIHEATIEHERILYPHIYRDFKEE